MTETDVPAIIEFISDMGSRFSEAVPDRQPYSALCRCVSSLVRSLLVMAYFPGVIAARTVIQLSFTPPFSKNNKNQNCQYMTRRIGSTTYKVKVIFSDNGGETMEEKILRMIRNEGLQNGEERGMMDAPQMSRQSERSAS